MQRIIFYILLILIPGTAFASDNQQRNLLRGANRCSNYFAYFEQKYNIPQHLLRSISVVETGRWIKHARVYLPWPWAVNQGGKSYYFENKNEAILSVKRMLEQGLTNIDIGCMQINLHHHPGAFRNLHHAFEPRDNIEYAANFLKSHYRKSENWQKAVAFYHSQAPIGETYSKKVLRIWFDYIEKRVNHYHCLSNLGEIMACETKETTKFARENLPLVQSNVTNKIIIPRKNLKRLRSAMIPYSTDNEVN